MSGVDIEKFNFWNEGRLISFESTIELGGIIQRGTVTAPELGWVHPKVGETDVAVRAFDDGGAPVTQVFVEAGLDGSEERMSDVEALRRAIGALQLVLERAEAIESLGFDHVSASG